MSQAAKIPFTPDSRETCPVTPATLVWVWISGDPPSFNPRRLKPVPASRYRWNRQSGIVAYAIAEQGKSDA